MKLFYSPGSCALAVHIVLQWSGREYQLERVNLAKPPESFLELNPMGQVPTLVLDSGEVLNQGDAILKYLAAIYPDLNIGAGDQPLDQFELNRWLAYLTGDLHPAFFPFFRAARFTTDDSETATASVTAAAKLRIDQIVSVLEAHLEGRRHIALDRRTVADPYAFAMLRWINLLDKKLEAYPNINRFVAGFSEDAGVIAAMQQQGIYKP